MANADSTTPNKPASLVDAADNLSEARYIVAFVQSIALNAIPGQSITLYPDQLSGMSYALQGVIDRIKQAGSIIDSARDVRHG